MMRIGEYLYNFRIENSCLGFFPQQIKAHIKENDWSLTMLKFKNICTSKNITNQVKRQAEDWKNTFVKMLMTRN